jgi:CspA family cold shock protein
MSERSFREPRRRGFDDEVVDSRGPRGFGAPPPRRQATLGPVTRATVKWFSPEKGFGFVVLDEGLGDAFLHASIVEQSGHDADAFQPGVTLQVRVGVGQKGPQVGEILEVDESTAVPRPQPARRPADSRAAGGQATRMTGTVKWYNAEKRFGFIAVEDGRAEVFVHATALQRSGVGNLSEGQRVEMEVAEGRKGLEAVTVSLRD